MSVTPLYNQVAFTGNPICIDIPDEFAPCPYTITQLESGQSYTGKVDRGSHINVADVVEAFLPDVALPGYTSDGSFIYSDFDNERRRFMLECKYGDIVVNKQFTALKGGVSQLSFRRLMAEDSDIFVRRFLNPTGNIFFTTRTAGWIIPIKETELFPLYFLSQSQDMEIFIRGYNSPIKIVKAETTPNLHVLDIEEIRRFAFSRLNLLVNEIDIVVCGNVICRIVIREADVASERYRVLFRNSYGVWELMEMIGTLSLANSERDGDETSDYLCYDSVTDAFVNGRMRVARTVRLSLNTGFKSRAEIPFVLDMLSSSDVYLLDYVDSPIKVIPSAEELNYRHMPLSPQSFDISFTVADKDTFIPPEYVDGRESVRPRIFSSEFTKQFN